jgi:indolepyruvate decarboxylase
MGLYELKPIIFVLNNDGYMVERALEADPTCANAPHGLKQS